MEFVAGLAAKSLVLVAMTLALLQLTKRRSSSDRSLIAHLGLFALAFLPVATVILPALEVPAPAFLLSTPTEPLSPPLVAAAPEVAVTESAFRGSVAAQVARPVDWLFWAYIVPAALLILLTLIAVGRLAALKARASVLVDPHWLSALAQAQRRMGMKNGTALLTSEELTSPVSWGVVRPVILLNGEAVGARTHAEAIIAHELAHVTHLDWAKLLLARLVVAIYWFNPFVWVLAREAHQLREEAADDAVLASNIDDTDYAKLLVGIARHECRGLFIGAHGVAPGRKSLSRRIRRVLDAASARAPGGWRWSSAAAFFAAGMAVPVAALQFAAPTMAVSETRVQHDSKAAVRSPHTAPTAAVTNPTHAPISSAAIERPVKLPPYYPVTAERNATAPMDVGHTVEAAVAAAAKGAATAEDAIDRAIELKAVGASPAYAKAMRKAAPQLRLDHDDIVELKTVGVSPDYVRDIAKSGYPRLTTHDIVEARTMGINGAYIRGIAAAGYGYLPMEQLVELKTIGVTPADVARYRHHSGRLPSVDQLVKAKAIGLEAGDFEHDGEP